MLKSDNDCVYATANKVWNKFTDLSSDMPSVHQKLYDVWLRNLRYVYRKCEVSNATSNADTYSLMHVVRVLDRLVNAGLKNRFGFKRFEDTLRTSRYVGLGM